MNKPDTLSIKNFLIRKLSVDLVIPEKIIDVVIQHEFQSALEAMRVCKSVEISGFCKFIFKDVYARYRLEKLETSKYFCEKDIIAPGMSERQVCRAKMRLKLLTDNIEYIKSKLDDRHNKDI